ncbi:hypothetical protein NFL01_23545 (plasmid) [Escherichia coli]|nr:hypothetical protein NFK99_23540 [Escherichia coli]WGA64039.1 hypothetical protein NFL01_23545 [Escherichia coli]
MSIKNDGHYFCRAGGNRPDGLNEPVTTNEYPEKNKQAVKHDIGDLAEHADTHGRNLTALGHILCVKTHDDIPKKKSQSD